MIPFARLEEVMAAAGRRTGYTLLDEKDGCTGGCRCGISIYRREEYDLERAAAHEDQEGFFVLEGRGRALIGGEELVMEPGVCFVVPAGTLHAMKRDADCEYCKVFWFHAAVQK